MAEGSEDLIGLSDRDLRLRAGEATHQHYKGGLYRLVGIFRDADTGEHVSGKDGKPRILYQHIYPHTPDFWVRDHSEFYGTVFNVVPRFRLLK